MKLLIVTQIVDKDDPILGFFHEWVRAFAGQVESIKLVGLEVGKYDFPSNVEVLSLGKESGELPTWRYVWRLNKIAWRERKNYEVVFAHMNPDYIMAGGLLWKIMGKTITMWYAHGATTKRLRLATLFCHRIFTSTPSGYRYENKKRLIVGQGIDVDKFAPVAEGEERDIGVVKLVTVGRITASKQLETLLGAIYKLRQEGYRFLFKIYGGANTEVEKVYEAKLKKQIDEWQISDQVEFIGPVSQSNLVKELHQSDIFISDGATGSLDKALLEAMATGLMVISSNESFGKIVPEPEAYTFTNGDSDSLASCLVQYLGLEEKEQLRARQLLRSEVVSNHSLAAFAEKIIYGIEQIHGKNRR